MSNQDANDQLSYGYEYIRPDQMKMQGQQQYQMDQVYQFGQSDYVEAVEGFSEIGKQQ